MEITQIIKEIQNNKTYNQVLEDSLGGIMYNTQNIGKYQDEELFNLIDQLGEEIEMVDGIMKGAIEFIQEGRDL